MQINTVCVHVIHTVIGMFLTAGASAADKLTTLPGSLFLLGMRAARNHPEWAAALLAAEGKTCHRCQTAPREERETISNQLLDGLVAHYPVSAVLEEIQLQAHASRC